jgi:hypothetical protein
VLANELLVVVEILWSAHHDPFYTARENPVPDRPSDGRFVESTV